jgi:hypothetical protein
MLITTANQMATSHGVKALVYGPAGAGKTSLCATCPSPIVLSAEAGLLALKTANIERMYGVGTAGITYDVPVKAVTTLRDIEEAYNYFISNADNGYFQTVCLDSLTEIGEVVLADAKARCKDPRQAYGELMVEMEKWIKKFRDLPNRHVLMTAKMSSLKDDVSGIVRNAPSMPGARLGAGLPYYFDTVFRMHVNRERDGSYTRFLQTQPDLQNDAKDRSGMLDAHEMPYFYNIVNKIYA